MLCFWTFNSWCRYIIRPLTICKTRLVFRNMFSRIIKRTSNCRELKEFNNRSTAFKGDIHLTKWDLTLLNTLSQLIMYSNELRNVFRELDVSNMHVCILDVVEWISWLKEKSTWFIYYTMQFLNVAFNSIP